MKYLSKKYNTKRIQTECSNLDATLNALKDSLLVTRLDRKFCVYFSCSFLLGVISESKEEIPRVLSATFDFDSLPAMESFAEDLELDGVDENKTDILQAIQDIIKYLNDCHKANKVLEIPECFFTNTAIMRVSVSDTSKNIREIERSIDILRLEIAKKEMQLERIKKLDTMRLPSLSDSKCDVYKISKIGDARFFASMFSKKSENGEHLDMGIEDFSIYPKTTKFPKYVRLNPLGDNTYEYEQQVEDITDELSLLLAM